jgi:hypothetical protein
MRRISKAVLGISACQAEGCRLLGITATSIETISLLSSADQTINLPTYGAVAFSPEGVV